MKISDLFKRKNFKANNNLETTPKNEDIKNLDIPRIYFEDLELQVAIGRWLGLLSSQKGFGTSSFAVYTHLSAEELMKRNKIPSHIMQEIAKQFGQLLKIAGVENSETCMLDEYNKKEFSFNCHFNNANDDASISLSWGNMLDDGPELTIDYHNSSKTFYYIPASEERPISLTLQHYTTTNPENNNALFHYLSPYSSSITLTSGEYKLTLNINKPHSSQEDTFSLEPFRLKNEKELEQYLLSLSFPFAISDIYKKIKELSLQPVSAYPRLDFKVEKAINGKICLTTEQIVLSYETMEIFTTTKNGKTISIDKNDKWSYQSAEVVAEENDELNITFNIKAGNRAEITSSIFPVEEMYKIDAEVQEVRELSTSIFKR